jgi:hypothetical protein
MRHYGAPTQSALLNIAHFGGCNSPFNQPFAVSNDVERPISK